jgi:hypothetical protein
VPAVGSGTLFLTQENYMNIMTVAIVVQECKKQEGNQGKGFFSITPLRISVLTQTGKMIPIERPDELYDIVHDMARNFVGK